MKQLKIENEESNKDLLVRKDDRINDIMREYDVLKEELNSIKDKMDQLNQQNLLSSDKHNQLQLVYEQSKNDSENFQMAINDLKADNEILNKKNDDLSSENERLKADLSFNLRNNLKREYDTEQENQDVSQQDSDNKLKHEIDLLRNSNEMLRISNEMLRNSNETKARGIEELSKENESLRQDLKASNETFSELEKVRAQNNELNTNLANVQLEIASLNNQAALSTQKYIDLADDNQAFSEQLSKAQEDFNQSKLIIEEKSKTIQTYSEELDRMVSSSRLILNDLESENDRLKRTAEELKISLEESNKECEQLKTKLADLSQTNDQLRVDHLEQDQTQKSNIKSECVKCNRMLGDNEELKKLNESMQNEIDELKRKISVDCMNSTTNVENALFLKQRVDELSGDNHAIRTQNTHLKTENESLVSNLSDINRKLDEALGSKERATELEKQKDDQLCELMSEKKQLKTEISQLQAQYGTLESEYEIHKADQNLLIEKYEHEIELNKSLLDLLNNETKLLTNEKSQLEQQISNLINKLRPNLNERTSSRDHDDEDTDNNQACNTDEIMQLNQQIEDLTFYIDELKSDLETEKEKNAESFSEIQANKKQVEDFEDQYNRIMKEFEIKSQGLVECEKTIDNYKLVFRRLEENEILQGFVDNSSDQDEDLWFVKNIDTVLAKISDIATTAKAGEEAQSSAQQQIIADLNDKLSKLHETYNVDIESLLNKFQYAQDELNTTKDTLNKANQKIEVYEKSSQKNHLMNLEMANYDRTLDNLNAQLANRDKQISDNKVEIQNLNAKIARLQTDMKDGEQARKESDEKIHKMKQLLVKSKKELSELKQIEIDKTNIEALLKIQIENARSELESMKVKKKPYLPQVSQKPTIQSHKLPTGPKPLKPIKNLKVLPKGII